VGSTILIIWPTIALNKLLLPTFGRPTIATVGNAISYLSIRDPEKGIITDLCPGKKGQITVLIAIGFE
jgi:hypothetical protein